ncbi:MAG: protein phosphatase 2C domain-containing protein [Isosphaeraceae bacterium]|nr:protein phosphatase 2C domain-containing protein [Isosphaeraceae bacterium]
MSEGDATDRYLARIEHLIASLRASGRLLVGDGHARTEACAVALHSSIGPEGSEKTPVNQDHGLVWINDSADPTKPTWITAAADGLTSAFWSERAAALAALAAARAILEKPGIDAADCLDAARFALADYLDDLREDLDATRPATQVPFRSTWQYMLDRGAILQTTLTVAWEFEGRLALVVVGDGGALLEVEGGREIVSACDLETERVNALNPRGDFDDEPAVVISRPIDRPYRLALFTDGIGRGLGVDSLALWDRLEALGGDNPPRSFIEAVCRDEPQSYDDNLTLILIDALRPR